MTLNFGNLIVFSEGNTLLHYPRYHRETVFGAHMCFHEKTTIAASAEVTCWKKRIAANALK